MSARKKSPRVRVDSRFDEASDPFEQMRVEIDGISIPAAHTNEPGSAKELARALVDKAEESLSEGKPRTALWLIWEAAMSVYIATHIAAPKIMARQQKHDLRGAKANVEAAWTRAFNTHIPFRRLGASDQAIYLTANYSKDVAGIKLESLTKYIRAFRKNA